MTLEVFSNVEPNANGLQYDVDLMTANSHIDPILMGDMDWRHPCLNYTAGFVERQTESIWNVVLAQMPFSTTYALRLKVNFYSIKILVVSNCLRKVWSTF
ncbi:hypothetical protein PoB_003766500 [Plakobranchus ocellatus]|uniref:Uncharacterized protein n=1 Tax=Plakobranchus ocellatus TaxID=259542 RepID=A0AAV4AWD8_9GAST|nr:hypothetical protein PoB_003766500 [Plakobranchus ocellatus]